MFAFMVYRNVVDIVIAGKASCSQRAAQAGTATPQLRHVADRRRHGRYGKRKCVQWQS